MKNKMIAKFTAALAIGSASLIAAATPAMARHHHYNDGYYGSGYGYNQYRGYRGDSGRYYGRTGYDRPVYYNGYRGDRGYRCRDNGTGGAVIGAIAGGLLGSQVAERGDRTTGAVVGGALGAVAGHLIDKSDGRRC